MNTKMILVLFMFLFGSLANAGDHKGNGGNSINCGETAYFYDFYVNPGTYPEMEGNEFQIAQEVLNQMQEFTPVRVELYRERLKAFLELSRFVSDAHLGVINDTGMSIPLPRECSVVQTIIQKIVVFGNEKRFLISRPQWDRLSPLHRAGLIIHELLYWEIQAEDSRKLGQFNAYLFQKLQKGYEKAEFFSRLKSSGLKWVYLHGIPMDVSLLTITEDKITSLSTYPDLAFSILNNEVTSVRQILDHHFTGMPKVVSYKGIVNFENSEYVMTACSPGKVCKMGLTPGGELKWLQNVELVHKVTGKRITKDVFNFDEVR